MADDTGPELPPVMTPGAQGALLGTDPLAGDDDAADRAERRQFFRSQMDREQRLEAREEELEKKRVSEEEPRMRAVEAAGTRALQTSAVAKNRLLTQQQDLPKFNPDGARGDALAWMTLASSFGAIAGAFSRDHTTAALNAFSGMLNGFAKGQLEVFNEKYKEWETETERAHEYNQRQLREYHAIMDDAKLDLDVKSNLMQMTANKWQDQIMALQAQQRSIERMTQLMYAQERADENMQLRKQAMQQHNTQWYDKLDADLAKRGLKRDGQTGKVVRDPNAAATGQTWQKQAFEDWRGEFIQREGHPPSAEEERQFGRTLQVVRSPQAMALQKYQEENPKATAKDYVAFAANLAGDIAAIRAAGNRAGQIAVSAEEAASTFKLASDASKGFPRYQYQPLNRLYQDAALVKSDPRYRTFMASNEAAVTAYGATMSRSGGNTVSAQTRAHEVLDTADSDEAYQAGLVQLQKEVDQVRLAPANARAGLLRALGIAPEGAPAAAPPATGGGGNVDLGDGWTGRVRQ